MKHSIQTLCVAVCLSVSALAQAEVAVIVNPGAAKAPSQADVSNIFLGKDKSMKGGGAAEDHIANQFLKRVLSALETESKEFTANDKTLTKTTETTLR